MGKRVVECYPGSEYKGYIAYSCTPTDWYNRATGEKMEAYRLILQTPFKPGISVEELNAQIQKDLSPIFPDIMLLDSTACNNRAFYADREYVPFGCTWYTNWAKGSVSLTLLLFEPFEGFPINYGVPYDEAHDVYLDGLAASYEEP